MAQLLRSTPEKKSVIKYVWNIGIALLGHIGIALSSIIC